MVSTDFTVMRINIYIRYLHTPIIEERDEAKKKDIRSDGKSREEKEGDCVWGKNLKNHWGVQRKLGREKRERPKAWEEPVKEEK